MYKKISVIIIMLISVVLLGSCVVAVEPKSYTKEEVYEIATKDIDIVNEYTLDPSFNNPYNWMNEEQYQKHTVIERIKRPDYSFVKASDDKYYLIEYIDNLNTNKSLNDLYQVVEMNLEVSPDSYYEIYETLTEENKAFVDLYMEGNLFIKLDQSYPTSIRLAKSDHTYVDFGDEYFYLSSDDHVIFISYYNETNMVKLNNENAHELFDIKAYYGSVYGDSMYLEYIGFEFNLKEGYMVHFPNVSFNFTVVVETNYQTFTFVDTYSTNGGPMGSVFTTSRYEYQIQPSYYTYTHRVKVELTEIEVISGLVYIQ